MHPRTIELLRHLDAHRATLRAAFDAMPEALRMTPPAPGRWSAAQVLEHLATVEAQVAALLKRGLRAALANGPVPPDPDHSPVLPTIDAALLLDRERKVAAPAAAQPNQGLGPDDAWRALAASRTSAREVLLAADGLATHSIRAPHPALGELTFHQWFAFLGYHEARHAAQIRATAAALAGNGP
jgi:hypothetical protein